jgi:hypothetical protein
MTGASGLWSEGQRAWERLAAWYAGRASGELGAQVEPPDRALTALSDVGLARRLLDQVEFEAVRTARRQGRSWAEIATMLGVTRQSAWERWHDIDDDTVTGVADRAVDELVRRAGGDPTEVPLDVRAARLRRRQSTVTVPNVVGMAWDKARRALHEVGLIGVSPDPDGPPLGALGWPDGVVTDQSPESGAKVAPGSAVTLWIERGGGSGVREPRRPTPDPKAGRKMRDEVTDEAVG